MYSPIFKKKLLIFLVITLALGLTIGGGRLHRVRANIDTAYEKLKILADVNGDCGTELCRAS